jgi:UPF0271 protein
MKLINVDLGECLEPNPDSQVMPLLDMANIACGGHAGDEQSILATLSLAKQHKKTIGAHPSYEDKAGFGRKSQSLTSTQLTSMLQQQIQLFQSCCEQFDLTMSYIKPHGALYHDMMKNQQVLADICQLIADFDANLSLVVQAGINTAEMEAISTKPALHLSMKPLPIALIKRTNWFLAQSRMRCCHYQSRLRLNIIHFPVMCHLRLIRCAFIQITLRRLKRLS